jgi:hypothetical protein
MAGGVFREVSITYNGVEHKFTPTMALLRTIERGDGGGPVSILELIHGANSGKPVMTFMAWLVALVMRHAGAEVSEEELYADMIGFDKEAFALYRDVINAISPTQKEKKAEVPEK